jgi:hypothetical protein
VDSCGLIPPTIAEEHRQSSSGSWNAVVHPIISETLEIDVNSQCSSRQVRTFRLRREPGWRHTRSTLGTQGQFLKQLIDDVRLYNGGAAGFFLKTT